MGKWLFSMASKSANFSPIKPLSIVLQSTIRRTIVGIGAERNVIKKIGTSVCVDVSIFYKSAYKFTIDPTTRISYDMFDF